MVVYDPPKEPHKTYRDLREHDILITDDIVSLLSLGTGGSIDHQSAGAGYVLQLNGSTANLWSTNFTEAARHAREEGTSLPVERLAGQLGRALTSIEHRISSLE